MSLSPQRRLWQARWTATSDDEQAVSTEMLGPRRSRRYDSRLASTLCSVPVSVRGVDRVEVGVLQLRVVVVVARDEDAGARCRASRSRGSPASSSASMATSRNSRCCGSMRSASRGRMPKKLGVEAVDRVEEAAPLGRASCRGADGSGSYQRVDVPAVGGHLAHGVDAVAQQLPEALGRVAAAGQAAAHADDRDRVGAQHALRLLRAPAAPSAPA